VLLADSSSGAAVLKRSLDGLMLLYSQASDDIRAGFQLYIGLDGGSQDMYQLAHQYALDSLGALKLVHNSRGSGSAGTQMSDASRRSSSTDRQKDSQGLADPDGSTSVSSGKGVGTLAQAGSSARGDHVRLMLHVVLQCFQYPSVLLLEDDWKLLPDFFEYFDAARWLLVSRPHPYSSNGYDLMAFYFAASQRWLPTVFRLWVGCCRHVYSQVACSSKAYPCSNTASMFQHFALRWHIFNWET
jgi:hypothetical protein